MITKLQKMAFKALRLLPARVNVFAIDQATIDDMYTTLKNQWDAQVKLSGERETMFIALNPNGLATQLLHDFRQKQLDAESLGFVMPDLVPGLTISYSNDLCRCGEYRTDCQNCGPVAGVQS